MVDTVRLLQEDNIGLVLMEEKEHKNTFSKRFIKDLQEIFDFIDRGSDLKVVVLHGYDNYFCCGGTKEELLDILEGKLNFSDLNFYDLLLACRLPVISAMGGHALGGGLVFGSYADVMVLAEECIYSTNFMKYGFTPGMGATYIIPRKFGLSLGWEMLFRAKNYYGRELKQRGAPFNITPKDKTLDTALDIARELADKPVLSLELLKRELTSKIRKELPEAVERELEMHKLSFAQPEVRNRIETLFGN